MQVAHLAFLEIDLQHLLILINNKRKKVENFGTKINENLRKQLKNHETY